MMAGTGARPRRHLIEMGSGDDDSRSAFRKSKDVLSESPVEDPDEMTIILLTMGDLPALLKVAGSRHGTYLLKMSRGGDGVIMEKLTEKT